MFLYYFSRTVVNFTPQFVNLSIHHFVQKTDWALFGDVLAITVFFGLSYRIVLIQCARVHGSSVAVNFSRKT